MNNPANRRAFLKTAALASAAATLPVQLTFAKSKSLLIFTKSSGFEHEVVKRKEGKLSIVETVVTDLGKKHGFQTETSKDGRIFDSPEFHSFQNVLFFTTGDLTQTGTDKNPPMSPAGKQTLLDTIRGGMGFTGVHAASDTFHTQPDSSIKSDDPTRPAPPSTIQQSRVSLSLSSGAGPKLQRGVYVIALRESAADKAPNWSWYTVENSNGHFSIANLGVSHVILTIDTSKLKGECYQRRPYPGAWARVHGKGRVFFTAIGDRPENWQNEFFLNHLAGGIRWSLGDASADVRPNLQAVTPGYADIPPQQPKKK